MQVANHWILLAPSRFLPCARTAPRCPIRPVRPGLTGLLFFYRPGAEQLERQESQPWGKERARVGRTKEWGVGRERSQPGLRARAEAEGAGDAWTSCSGAGVRTG